VTGRNLGNYQILDRLGTGGMGEVYKARDLRLNRLVAIKILRTDRSTDPTRRQRFAQEARSASALNHPNIVAIYDVFEHDGMDCLVMELIAGDTLDALIPRTGMRWPDALRIAIPVAEGLRKAHAAGIVHRDLKPSNVMVADDGPVKILDFGIAKIVEAELGENDATRTAAPVTAEGAVMGTVNYMSPEQAQARHVDARSDIFSFGVMLYEMLVGGRVFQEDSAIGTLAAILHRDPPPLDPAIAPPALSRILQRCMKKNPDDRWQSISDVKQLLEDVGKDVAQPAAAAIPTRSRAVLPIAVAAALIAGAAIALLVFRTTGSEPAANSILPAALRMITADSGLSGYPAISRDGKLIAFASDRANGDNLDIWVQQVGGRDPIRLTNDPVDETTPAFSPDGTTIAFRSEKDGGGIYVMPALGGAAALLAPKGRNPLFSPDGKWVAYSIGGDVVANPGSTGVFIVSAGGGEPRAVHPEMATATNPVWSPQSDRLLVLARKDAKAPVRKEVDWWILPIDGGEPRRTGVYPRLDRQGLLAPHFPQGYPGPLNWREKNGDQILFSAIFGEGADLREISLAGTGDAQRLTLGPGTYDHANWSADGRRLAFADEDLKFDVWLQPLDRTGGAANGPMRRITDNTIEQLLPSMSWDAAKLAWVSHRPEGWSLDVREGASGARRSLLISATKILAARLSGDGAHVVYSNSAYDLMSVPFAGGLARKLCEKCGIVMGASTDGADALYEPMENEDVLLWSAQRNATAKMALRPNPEYLLSSSRFSRDGKWIAFHALHNATDTGQIWIAPATTDAPAPQSQWIAITDGSKLERDPAWSADGRFLYFASERDGYRCIWARPLDPATKRPTGEAFAVRHLHSARFSMRHVGRRGFYAGITAGEGALVFAIGELKANVWMIENAATN
jgi:Tol biopolymer transport system component